MNILRNLFGPKSKRAVSAPDGPPARDLAGTGSENPLTALLSAWGLPLDEPRSAIEARNGIVSDPIYNWPTLLLPEAEQLPGAMRPWAAYVHDRIPPQFPISRFSGLVWLADDADFNLRRTGEHIAKTLGPAPIGRRWNTVVASWTSDLAEIRLTAWPPHLQSDNLQNPAEERYPRLRSACHVEIATGLCLTLSEVERQWVSSSQRLRTLSIGGTPPQSSAPLETQLEYARRLEAGISTEPRLSIAAGGEALVVLSSQLYVIPRSAIRRLEVVRLTPAKGSGGATLYAICDSAAPNSEGQSLFLAADPKTDGLNEFAQNLADQIGCPLDIGQAFADC
ncbi:hypothetical protein DevBK_10185 [Devosia sp. BK]|uniref:hypothetical protein n=1 Tax=Devosia sp. BK TaxID=2871706 RepID=UPI00293B18C6|nr:hypothetical protein [Devosia sp. BK]MDV3251700.1 hypothetical protein [Devosia sp. BK]